MDDHEPAAHAMHEVAPADDAHVPAAQNKHWTEDVIPRTEDHVPELHEMQTLALEAPLTEE